MPLGLIQLRRQLDADAVHRGCIDARISIRAEQADIENAVLALEAVQRALEGKRPKKVIIVPQRIVNVVA